MKPIVTWVAVGYAVVMSTLIATGSVGRPQETSFGTINVQRINLREPDGTLRMILSDKASFPGIMVHGAELPHASRRDVAGMIFLNDEGTENGGLIFAGAKAGGVVHAGGHLSFDQYEQDQVLSLEQTEDGAARSAGLGISDRPSGTMDFAELSKLEAAPDGPAKTARLAQLDAAGAFGHPRLFLGKSDDASMLSLRDALGRKRLVLKVTGDGAASIQFLDAEGKVLRTVVP